MRGRDTSPETIEAMFLCYQSGMNQSQVAATHGLSQPQVSQILRKHPDWSNRRNPTRRKSVNPRPQNKVYDREQFLVDYQLQMTIEDIAKKHNVSSAIVIRRLRQNPKFVERKRPLKKGCYPIVLGRRVCLSCHGNKLLSEFPRHKASSLGVLAHCNECTGKIRRSYLGAKYKQLKESIFRAYGNCCAACGFSNPLALHIDHVNNNGAEERRKIRAFKFLRKIISDGFPPAYQILCANCNTIKAHDSGSFKHAKKKEVG